MCLDMCMDYAGLEFLFVICYSRLSDNILFNPYEMHCNRPRFSILLSFSSFCRLGVEVLFGLWIGKR